MEELVAMTKFVHLNVTPLRDGGRRLKDGGTLSQDRESSFPRGKSLGWLCFLLIKKRVKRHKVPGREGGLTLCIPFSHYLQPASSVEMNEVQIHT